MRRCCSSSHADASAIASDDEFSFLAVITETTHTEVEWSCRLHRREVAVREIA
jgi:hypothetical protein